MDKESMLEVAIQAAVSAGNLLTEYYNETFDVSVKESLRDVVSEVDRMAEQKIVKILQKYDKKFSIMTEEHGEIYHANNNRCWIVDALDGTVNYVNRIPFFCVSIALVEKSLPIIGVIYNPMSKDLYYGAIGMGVFKNQKMVRVRNRMPEDCLFSAAFSGKRYDIKGRKNEFLLFGEINDESKGCLRTGSAAMNLAYLSEGKFNGCWGKANKFWDVAAGLVIAELAGAKIKFHMVDEREYLVNYLAAVPSAWEFLNKKTRLF